MSTLVATTNRDVVTVAGPDAPAYLQGQLSQDVAAMAHGDTAWTFVLAPQGKVEGWGRVHRLDDERYSIVVDEGAGEAWEQRLRRFLLRTRAEIDVTEAVAVVAVRGAGSTELVAGLTGAAGAGWRPAGWPSVEGFDRVSGADHGDVVAALVAAGADAVGPEALDAVRIAAGVPAWGAELDGDTIPATVGQWAIDASVSFTKGCYTGQELVARIDSRGGNVPRSLHGLVLDGPAVPPGTPVHLGSDGVGADDALGAVTSSAPRDGGGSVALLFVPRSVDVPEDGLSVSVGGGPGRLRRLPL